MAPRPELTPEQEQQARELADRIQHRSREVILEMARRLAASSDRDLFGDTQLALRDQALGLVAEAYAERAEKKVLHAAFTAPGMMKMGAGRTTRSVCDGGGGGRRV
jgi:hypothetical protein